MILFIWRYLWKCIQGIWKPAKKTSRVWSLDGAALLVRVDAQMMLSRQLAFVIPFIQQLGGHVSQQSVLPWHGRWAIRRWGGLHYQEQAAWKFSHLKQDPDFWHLFAWWLLWVWELSPGPWHMTVLSLCCICGPAILLVLLLLLFSRARNWAHQGFWFPLEFYLQR